MGQDKALLDYGGEPHVLRIVRLLEHVAPPVYVSVRKGQTADSAFSGLRLLPDQEEGIGPMAGLLSAFREDATSPWLVVAVDLPHVSEETLRLLVEHRDPSVCATAFRNPEIGQPEPVCAIYEPRILPVLLNAAAQGRYTLKFLRDVPVCLVDPANPRELSNVNSPEEYRRAREE